LDGSSRSDSSGIFPIEFADLLVYFVIAFQLYDNSQSFCSLWYSMYYFIVEDVNVDVRKDGRSLNCTQLEKQYHNWINNMHAKYDVEIDGGDDEHTVIINPSSKERLGISEDGEGLPCDFSCSSFRIVLLLFN
jgi:hypothetical protein